MNEERVLTAMRNVPFGHETSRARLYALTSGVQACKAEEAGDLNGRVTMRHLYFGSTSRFSSSLFPSSRL